MLGMFAAAAWIASLLANPCGGTKADNFHSPPSAAGEDERPVSDHAGFDQCEAVIQLLASKVNNRIENRKYSVSKQWGLVLRATLVPAGKEATAAPAVICWTGEGSGVRLMVDYLHTTPVRPGR